VTEPTAARRFGTTRGDFAILVAATVVASIVFPGAGLLVAFASRFTGVRGDRRRTRTLFVVAVGILVLQLVWAAIGIWGRWEVCTTIDGGPQECQTS
jgi:uncharacterized membrane protein (DUF485 family)